MKKCSKCGVEKDFSEFSKRESSCKCCKKKYYESNKEYIKGKAKKYYEAHKEKAKKYYEDNKERLKESRKKYYESNKEKFREYNKQYRENNKEYYKEYSKERRKTDPLFKMSHNLRDRTYKAFKSKGYSKNTKTQEMLGVDWEVCKQHIEKQFTEGMNWDNQGEWQIDHIIPLASANNEKELMKLCHYRNLQPLWAEDNLVKKDKIQGQQTFMKL